MSDAVVVALIMSIAPAIIGIATIIGIFRTKTELRNLTIHINSRMDQLIESRAAQGHSEGKAEGIAEERDK